MSSFQEKLTAASRKNESLVCVGLDPDPALMPIDDVLEFNKAIIEATADQVCCYKPNMAFYEALGIPGLEALQRTLEHIPDDIPVIGDAKRGDIGSTAKAYARAVFDWWGFDAVTVSPYLGTDSIEPFLEYSDRGVLVLCHTSGPGSVDFQDLPVGSGNPQRPLFEEVALKVSGVERQRQRRAGGGRHIPSAAAIGAPNLPGYGDTGAGRRRSGRRPGEHRQVWGERGRRGS